MNRLSKDHAGTVQHFEPDSDVVYTIDTAACLAHVSRRTILVYYRHGLVLPVIDQESGRYYFDEKAIRRVRQGEYLRLVHGISLGGAKMILDLINEVERLEAELRFLQQRDGEFADTQDQEKYEQG